METGYKRPAEFEKLFQFIQTYHPQLVEEYMQEPDKLEQYINDRVNAAQKAYSTTLKTEETVNDYQLAEEIANEVLYAGLRFSPISYLSNIYTLEFQEKDKTRQELLTVYHKVKQIFDKYDLHDQFEGSDEDVELEQELILFMIDNHLK